MAIVEPLGPSTSWPGRTLTSARCGRKMASMMPLSCCRGGRKRSPSRSACPRYSVTRSTPRAGPPPPGAETGPASCAGRWRSRSATACRPRRAGPTRICMPFYCGQRRFDEAERCFAEGIAYCDEHDIGTYSTCLRGERTGALEKTGRWEESASLSVELLADGGASPVNQINPLTSLGRIRARRAAPGCLGMPRRGGGSRGRERRAAVARARAPGPRRGVLAGGRASLSRTRSRAGR